MIKVIVKFFGYIKYCFVQIRYIIHADDINFFIDIPAKEHHVNILEYHPEKYGYDTFNNKPYNLGDALGPIIVKHLLDEKGIDIDAYIPEKKHLFTVGSCIFGGVSKGNYQNATIWGSGILRKPARLASFFQKVSRRKLDIRAVRGPLTRQVLLEFGHDCPEVYGDPAILMPLIYKPESTVKKYKKLVIPQFYHEIQFRKDHPDERMVSMNTNDYKYVIDEIVASEILYTSSLHGIILAESYGVPAVFFRGLDEVIDFKYRDWYESTGRKDVKFASSYEEALTMAPPKLPDFQGLVKGLLDCFPYNLWKI